MSYIPTANGTTADVPLLGARISAELYLPLELSTDRLPATITVNDNINQD